MSTISCYAERRARLWQLVNEQAKKPTAIVVFAALEPVRTVFWQESNFYYLTGITEPGWVLVIDAQGISHLYVPETTIDRSVWLATPDHTELDRESGPYQWHSLGEPYGSYSLSWYAPAACYTQLTADLQVLHARGVALAACMQATDVFATQREFAYKIAAFMKTEITFFDSSDTISSLRRRKDAHELALIHEAITITAKAHNDARTACHIAPGISEAYVKASLEMVMVAHGARPAFPSIVATGANGTVLHYTGSSGVLKNNDLVVIDIGASWHQYAADITRTYAVLGQRTLRQEELYQQVLAVQQEIASLARPGIWLKNSKYPEQSLHHRAVALFKKQKLDQYFMHGIGHYLGLDVHDVGSYAEPLSPGDVITIEPGLYIRDEGIGIRIEDNYLITEQGAECLSAAIPN